jgi:hypothetical protein
MPNWAFTHPLRFDHGHNRVHESSDDMYVGPSCLGYVPHLFRSRVLFLKCFTGLSESRDMQFFRQHGVPRYIWENVGFGYYPPSLMG